MPILGPSDKTGKPIVRTTNRPYGWWVNWQSKFEDGVEFVFDASDGQVQTKASQICTESSILVVGGLISTDGISDNIGITTNAIIPPTTVEESTEGSAVLIDHPDIPGAHIIVPADSGTHNIVEPSPIDSDDSPWDWDYLTDEFTPAELDDEGNWAGEYALMDVGFRLKNLVNITLLPGTFEFLSPDPMKFHKNHKLEITVDFKTNTTGKVVVVVILYTPHSETELL